ncbi:hypothetical protein KKH59_05830, partial [Patescibacteria group bacterium]|nr:hypothetical protein [Patescibacteria group bacterium]
RHGRKDVVVEPNKITIFYDATLEKITGISFEETMVQEDFTFADFLHSLFVSYPEIPKRMPPGKLGFWLNGRRPQTFDVIGDGDRVELVVMDKQIELTKEQIKDVRSQVEAELFGFIEKYKVDITLKKIKEVILNESNFRDFHSVIDVFSKKIEDLEESNQVLNILMKAWDYFPHKSLDDHCPLEKLSQFQENNPYRQGSG